MTNKLNQMALAVTLALNFSLAGIAQAGEPKFSLTKATSLSKELDLGLSLEILKAVTANDQIKNELSYMAKRITPAEGKDGHGEYIYAIGLSPSVIKLTDISPSLKGDFVVVIDQDTEGRGLKFKFRVSVYRKEYFEGKSTNTKEQNETLSEVNRKFAICSGEVSFSFK
jgi:hypothetical protein